IGPVATHALWTVVLAKLLCPPLLVVRIALPASIPAINEVWRVDHLEQQPAPDSIAAGTELQSIDGVWSSEPLKQQVASNGAGVPLSDGHRTRMTIGAVAMATWLTGAVLFASIQLLRIVRLAKRVRSGRAAEPSLAALVDSVAAQMKIRRVSCRVIDDLRSPVIWCV